MTDTLIDAWNVPARTIGTPRYRAVSDPARFFTFRNISGLTCWLRADKGLYQDAAGSTAATADTDPVGKWEDQSGNGNHATQSTAGSRPILKLNQTNGRPVLRFDGTDDFLSGAALSSLIAADAYTVVAVFKATAIDTNTANGWLNDPIVGDENGNFGVVLKSAPSVHAFNYDGTNDVTTAISIDTSSYFVVSTYHSGGNIYCLTNGANEQSTASGDTASLAFNIGIGSGYSVSRKYLEGDIAELAIFNVALSTGNRQRIERDLGARYGITVA